MSLNFDTRFKTVFLILLFGSTLSAQTVKGLYVDGFINILGNTPREDSLLNYAHSNGFNYLALYDLHLVQNQYDFTNVSTIAPMANFINRAKTQFGILQVGAIGENFWFFQNRISIYNQAHPNVNEKFDVYNLEFEFWNTSSTGPSGYYCTTYLQPASLPCDTAGAFSFYKIQLRQIDSLATVDNAISETYVGWPNAGQAHQIAVLCDRVLVHAYVTSDNSEYAYTQTRLSYFGTSPNAPVNIIVIFSSEPAFMGPWLITHPETQAFSTYYSAFQNDNSSWTNGINLIGYQWFDYSDMPYLLPLKVDELQNNNCIRINLSENELHIFIQNISGDKNAVIFIYNSSGQLVKSESHPLLSGENKFNLDIEKLANGCYFLNVQFQDSGSANTKFILSN
jgi:hypothetical protein